MRAPYKKKLGRVRASKTTREKRFLFCFLSLFGSFSQQLPRRMTSTATVSTRRASKAGDGKRFRGKRENFFFCRTPSATTAPLPLALFFPFFLLSSTTSALFLLTGSQRVSQRCGGGWCWLCTLAPRPRRRERRKKKKENNLGDDELAASGRR